MINLRFPNDVDKLAEKENPNDPDRYVPSQPNRYFKIIVKELPTGYDYVVGKASDAITAVTSFVTGTETNSNSSDTADKTERGKAALENNGVTATVNKLEETAKNTNLIPNFNEDDSKSIAGIALPLPNELNESLSHNWEKQTSVLADVGGAVVDKVGNKLGFGQVNAAKAIKQMAYNVVRTPLFDPGYFQDYKGTEPRTFSFSWDLIPRNREEAIQIREIITHLKMYSLPSRTELGVVMNSPHHFDIEFGNEFFRTMVNMQGLVCTQLDVNYSVDGTMQMTEDGMPKYVRLSMSFTERRTMYSQDFEYKDLQK